MSLASLGRRGGDFGDDPPARAAAVVHSNPKLFESFEIADIDDPKLLGCLESVQGHERGDLIFVQVKRSLGLIAGTKVQELLISVVFRWDGGRWVAVAPGRS